MLIGRQRPFPFWDTLHVSVSFSARFSKWNAVFHSELAEITAFRVIKDQGCPNLLMSSVPIVSPKSTNQLVFIIEMRCVSCWVEIGCSVFPALNSYFRWLFRCMLFNISQLSCDLRCYEWADIARSVQPIATGWTVRWSNLGGREVFRTRPDQPGGPPCLFYNG